ncbi:MAG: hypothetical protein ABS37_11800 [Acidovorax sp. SCN 65-108]|nr:MAG: hypothetical protein ABS37_11800 [Acidovorax sp. SCN 65-108]OJV61532.1 MAG: hypothetical protein BGO35_18455 [Burkholderiales bacterium 64-34]
MRLGVAAIVLSAVPLAWAATWQVNRVDDPASGSAARCAPGNAQTCSLRDAIAAAQHGDTVAFDGAVFAAPQVLAVGRPLVIARAITLRGPGASLLTLDGQNAVHLLEVNAGTASAGVPVSGPVHISGLAFANGTTAVDGGVNMNGNSGSVGGIANWGTLTLDDVKVTGMWAGNVGAGIGNGPAGRLTIVRSEVSGNSTGWRGGGIYNSPNGVITIDRSTIANNTVREGEFGHSGGGVASYGALTIDRSTLSGNQVFSSACHGNVCGGGGIAASALTISNSTISGNRAHSTVGGDGGGIALAVFNGTITVRNCTFAGNRSGAKGGAFRSSDDFSISNSTFTGNTSDGDGGAISVGWIGGASVARIDNSTIVNNVAGGLGGGIHIPSSGSTVPVVQLFNSIVSGNAIQSYLTDVYGSDVADDDLAVDHWNVIRAPASGVGGLYLQPLGDYGGPTQTMPPGGPASRAWAASRYAAGEPATDQRGVARPATVGAAVDAGAVQVSTTLPSITELDPAKGPPAGGYAVTVRGFNLSGGTLNFDGTPVSATGSITHADGSMSLTAAAPPGTAGSTVRVRYTVGANASPDVPEDDFTYTSQAVSFTTMPPSPAVAGSTYTVAATGGASGNPVVFSTVGPCTVAGQVVSFNGAGTCTIHADQAGDAVYPAAPRVSQSTAVVQAGQVIAFTTTPPSPAVAGRTYTVAATGGASGNPVVFTTAGACTVAGQVVSFNGAGTCTIYADQAGNAHYAAAARQQQAFAIVALLKTFTGTTLPASGAGGPASASIGNDGGALCQFDPAATAFEAATPPPGRVAPQGAFRFRLIGCDAGATVRVTTTWPQPVADFVKRTGSGQFIVPVSVGLGSTTVGFDVTDNQPGDDDAAPGVIADPVMPLAAAALQAIPALSPWALLLLGVMAGALGMVAQRRRA